MDLIELQARAQAEAKRIATDVEPNAETNPRQEEEKNA